MTKNIDRGALSIAELAARWGVCRQTIYSAINDGQISVFKLRDRTLISVDQVTKIENTSAELGAAPCQDSAA